MSRSRPQNPAMPTQASLKILETFPRGVWAEIFKYVNDPRAFALTSKTNYAYAWHHLFSEHRRFAIYCKNHNTDERERSQENLLQKICEKASNLLFIIGLGDDLGLYSITPSFYYAAIGCIATVFLSHEAKSYLNYHNQVKKLERYQVYSKPLINNGLFQPQHNNENPYEHDQIKQHIARAPLD